MKRFQYVYLRYEYAHLFFQGIGNIATCLITKPQKASGFPRLCFFELEVGIAKSTSPRKRRMQLENFTSTVNILPLGHNEVKFAAAIRADLEKQGKPIGPYDVLIAGTALANKGILITHNTSEFGRIKGLQIEDWY